MDSNSSLPSNFFLSIAEEKEDPEECAASPEPERAVSLCEPRHGTEQSADFGPAMKHELVDELADQETTDNTATTDTGYEARKKDDLIWNSPPCSIFEKTSVSMQQQVQIFTPDPEQYAAHTESSYNALSTDIKEVAEELIVPIKMEVDVRPMCMGSMTSESAQDEHFQQAAPPAVSQDLCLQATFRKDGPPVALSHAERPTADRQNTEDCILSQNTRIRRLINVWKTSQKLFVCSVCNRGFPRLSQLEEHRATHQASKPFRCLECGKSFTQKTRLKTHQSVHTGERPFSCKICGKMFSRQDNCLRHERFHSGLKPYSCGQCGKSFTVLANLKIHQEIHLQGR